MDFALIASLVGNAAFASGAAIAALRLAEARATNVEYEAATATLCDKLSGLRGENAKLTAANDKLKAELKPLREAEATRQDQRRKALAAAQARNAEIAAAKKNGVATKPARKRAKA